MVAPLPETTRASRLVDRLAANRHHHFVGRAVELELMRQALDAPEPPFTVLHVHGPGGVGKTALLREFAHIADGVGRQVVWLDGREIDASPAGFLLALGQALGTADPSAALPALATDRGVLLLIDAYETLAPLDLWLREVLLPQLPARSLVAIAGRNPPAPPWRADLEWRGLVRSIALRNLSPDESRRYLQARGVPQRRHPGVLAFTHGHPLALALITDVLAEGPDRASFLPEDAPDIVQALLERFVQHVPSPLHRDALEVCAHARVTTEALLADVLGTDTAPDLFSWLRGLSFIEQGPQGLFPHDLAREVLDADLRWRSPRDYRELHGKVRRFVVRTLQSTTEREQQRAAFDLLYLHRGNPVVRPIHDWDALATGYAEPATPADIPAILELVQRHEGPASAAIAAHWTNRQLAAFSVCRGPDGVVTGFVAALPLHQPLPEDLAADPAIAAAWRFAARNGPLRPGEELLYHRFQMGRDTYQTPSAAMNLMAMTCALHWVTNARLAWSFLAIAEPEQWHPVFTYLNLQRSPEAEFAVDGRYAVYTHDWRAEPGPLWLEQMARGELDSSPPRAERAADRPPPLVALSEPEFAAAVRQALRDYTRPEALAANPLLRSRLIRERAAATPDAATLQAVIRDVAAQLRANPRDEKLYRAIHRTYLEPAATQELAAERLGLPFSSYRRHLTAGIARITAWLWQRELHNPLG